MAAPLTVERGARPHRRGVAPTPAESRRHRGRAPAHAGRSAGRAPHAAAVRCLRHGRLCRARRRCREPAGHARRDRPGRRRPPLRRHRRRGTGRAHLHRRAAAGRRRRHRHPGEHAGATATGSPCTRAASMSATSATRGFDFREGQVLLGRRPPPRARASCRSPPPWDTGQCRCAGAPRVAVLSTGDELVAPGRAAGTRPDHLLQPPGRRRACRGRRRRGRAPRHRPRHAREPRCALRHARKAPTSSSPSAAPRSATTTSSAPCSRRAAWSSPSGSIAMRPGQPLMFGRLGPPACWACPATRSRRWCARACSCCR